MKIIVLSLSKFKENDVIYNAISEEGSLSFKAYRGQDNKSEYVWLNNQLTIADVEFADRRYKYPTLKEAKLIRTPFKGGDSFEYMCSISAITEITTKVLPDDERFKLFPHIEQAIDALQRGIDHLMVISVFLANAVKFAGGELEVDRCVFCGTTSDVTSFSFADGGFVCRKCALETNAIKLNPMQMKLIRYIFKAPNYECPKSEIFDKLDKEVVLNNLVQYVLDMNGVSLTAVKSLF